MYTRFLDRNSMRFYWGSHLVHFYMGRCRNRFSYYIQRSDESWIVSTYIKSVFTIIKRLEKENFKFLISLAKISDIVSKITKRNAIALLDSCSEEKSHTEAKKVSSKS